LHIQRDTALMSRAPLDQEMGAFSSRFLAENPLKIVGEPYPIRFLRFPQKEKTKAPQTQVWVLGRPSNSPPPELLNCSLDSFLLSVNGSVVPANQHHWATRSRP